MAYADDFDERFTGYPRGWLDYDVPATTDIGFPKYTKTKPWTGASIYGEGMGGKFQTSPFDPDATVNLWGNLMKQTAEATQEPTPSYRPRTPDPWSGQGGRNYWENLGNRTPLDIGALVGSPWPTRTEISDDPFERAALRTRQAARPEGGRQQGMATVVPEAMAADIAGGIWPALKSGPELLKTLSALPSEMRTDPEVQEELGKRGAGVALSFGLMNAPVGALNYARGAALSSQKPLAPLATLGDKNFYSALENHVENAPTKSAPASQWAATIKNAPIKGEELADNGILPWLEEQGNKPITKQQVLDEIKTNTPQVEVHEKGEAPWREDEIDETAHNRAMQMTRDDMRNLHPGMHEDDWPLDEFEEALNDNFHQAYSDIQKENKNQTKYGPDSGREDLVTPGPLDDPHLNYHETLLSVPQEKNAVRFMNKPEYQSSHWDEPNVIAHYRTTDRELQDPTRPMDSEKVLHGEEFQSDWHQQGRRNGYRGVTPPIDTSNWYVARSKIPEDPYPIRVIDHDGRIVSQRGRALEHLPDEAHIHDAWLEQQRQRDIGKVPDAPFKNSWHELAFKHFLKKAVDEGKDAVTWTTGDTQARRYPEFNNVVDTQGNPVPTKRAKGMEAFYDEKMVNSANKIGKRYGAKVEQRTLNENDPEGYPEVPVHYMKITPAMREAVGGKRGFSLYEDTTPESLLSTLRGGEERVKTSPENIGDKNMPSTQVKEREPESIYISSPQAAMANFLAKSKLEQGTSAQWLAELERAPANITATKSGPLEKVMQTPTSRRQFLQGAARVPLVLRNMKSLADWLGSQEGLLTKQQVMKHIGAQAPKLKVIEKAGIFDDDTINNLAEKMAHDDGNSWTDIAENGIDDSYIWDAENELKRAGHVGSESEHEHRFLPGGENPRETLMQLPSERIPIRDKMALTQMKVTPEPGQSFNQALINAHNIPSEEIKQYRELKDKWNAAKPDFMSGSHDEPNILMSYLTTDRDIGGLKSLHGEEFKSDWHDQGKEEGYNTTPKLSNRHAVDAGHYWKITDDSGKEVVMGGISKRDAPTAADALKISNDARRFVSRAVPDAPLKNNWHEVAFDHFLQKAAKEGYDAVSWTPSFEEKGPAADLDRALLKHANKYGKVEDARINTGEEDGPHEVYSLRLTPELKGKILRADQTAEGGLSTIGEQRKYDRSKSSLQEMVNRNFSQVDIANELGISRKQVQNLMKVYGLKSKRSIGGQPNNINASKRMFWISRERLDQGLNYGPKTVPDEPVVDRMPPGPPGSSPNYEQQRKWRQKAGRQK